MVGAREAATFEKTTNSPKGNIDDCDERSS